MLCLYAAENMTKCPLTRDVRLREVAVCEWRFDCTLQQRMLIFVSLLNEGEQQTLYCLS